MVNCLSGGLFAALNSGNGFVSFYSEIFGSDKIRRRYLIKGGPGTGKSTLMKRVGEEAEKRGLSVEYYRCSSDPESLDAVLVEGCVAILDSTAPHAEEARIPGAVDRLIDLGVFWDCDRLSEREADIRNLSQSKADCYRRAYRFLNAALEVDRECRELISPYIARDKMRRAVERLLRDLPRGNGYAASVGIRDSVGMRGRVCLDTYERTSERIYSLRDVYGCGNLFLAMVIDEAAKKEIKVRVSYSPIDPSYPDAVLFEDCKWAFVIEAETSPGAFARINTERFVNFSVAGITQERAKKIKREHKLAGRLYEGLVRSAEDCLEEAGKYHFELEEIYGKCIDFEAQSNFVTALCDKILAEAKDLRDNI